MAQRVAIGLNKLGLAMKSHAWAGAGERRLTPTQGQILALLRSRAERALRLTQVAELLAISAPTASDSVRALVNKGLVRKTRAPSDARAIALELTPTGVSEAERAASWPDFLLSAIETLTPREQEALLLALVKMIGALADRDLIPLQRMCVMCRHFRPNVHPESDAVHHCASLDAPLANRHLRLDCSSYESAEPSALQQNLAAFAGV